MIPDIIIITIANTICIKLMGIEIPAAYGGSESSFTSAIIAIEELAKVDPSVSVMCDVHNTLVNTVLRKYATDAQKEKWLPLLATDQLGCFCLSEPASGSDAFALQTRAKKVGDDYVLNGTKMWITNSYEGNIFLIFANVRIYFIYLPILILSYT